MTDDATRRGLRVLVVDDDEDIRRLVSLVLSRDGLETESAADGAEALGRVRTSMPDLLVLDVTMPELDGYAVLRALRESGAEPCVIFLTARADTSAVVAGLELGAADYVVKPFQPAELLARVRAALRTKTLVDALAHEATHDGLTGVRTRRRLDERAADELALAHRHERALALLMVDVDRFKVLNDTQGHAAGDRALRLVAASLREVTRSSDVVGRYGGDEFAVLLPGTDLAGGEAVVRRLRACLARRADEARLPLSVSAGVAERSLAERTPEDLYAVADAALYAAKARSRASRA